MAVMRDYNRFSEYVICASSLGMNTNVTDSMKSDQIMATSSGVLVLLI